MVGTETQSYKTRFGHQILEGWDDYSRELGKPISTLKVYANRDKDPLPVQKDLDGRGVWGYLAEVHAWAERQGWRVRPAVNSGPQ